MIVRRTFAFLIDLGLAYLLMLIPFLGWLFGGFFILLRDGLTKQGSPGKNILNLKVTSMGSRTIYEESVRRNIIFAAPFVFSIIPTVGSFITLALIFVAGVIEILALSSDPQGLRYGDRWAHTEVSEVQQGSGLR